VVLEKDGDQLDRSCEKLRMFTKSLGREENFTNEKEGRINVLATS